MLAAYFVRGSLVRGSLFFSKNSMLCGMAGPTSAVLYEACTNLWKSFGILRFLPEKPPFPETCREVVFFHEFKPLATKRFCSVLKPVSVILSAALGE